MKKGLLFFIVIALSIYLSACSGNGNAAGALNQMSPTAAQGSTTEVQKDASVAENGTSIAQDDAADVRNSPANTAGDTSGTGNNAQDNGTAGLVVYQNDMYGFDFNLPASWKGYTIVDDKWEGVAIEGSQGEKVVETGPVISIRHPRWTAEKPRQDIPVMVFTQAQWSKLQQDEFHIGAAPIGPSELGHNSKYVFALPARYNYAFPEGFEEVEKILEGSPLKAYDKENMGS